MKSFHFTLEAVRTVRQRQEQEAMEQYAQALLLRRQALDHLNAAQRNLNTAWQELRALLAEKCTAANAAHAHDYQRALEKRCDECTADLGVAERRVNIALQAMLNSRRQREIVDKCFEKQKSRHQREVLRGEQKFLDDLAGRRSSSIMTWSQTEALP
jgi:flagellar export protein FliJ